MVTVAAMVDTTGMAKAKTPRATSTTPNRTLTALNSHRERAKEVG